MHGLEEASASQMHQPSRVIAIGAARQRPRVFLMCAWVRRRWFGYPAVRVRCGEGDRARPRAWTRRPRPTPRPLPPTGIHKLYERRGRVLFEESRILTREMSGEPG